MHQVLHAKYSENTFMKNSDQMLNLLHQKLEYIQSRYEEFTTVEGNEEQFQVLQEKRDELMAEILRIEVDHHFNQLDLSHKSA